MFYLVVSSRVLAYQEKVWKYIFKNLKNTACKTSSWTTEKYCLVSVAAVLEKKRGTHLAGIDRENILIFLRVKRVSARMSHARGGASDPEKNERLPVVCWLDRSLHNSHVITPKYLSENFQKNV